MEALIIDTLIIDEDRPEHIAKHQVTVDEVLEVLIGEYIFTEGKLERWLLIGKTEQGRFLAIILGERKGKNTYGLVTARNADKKERGFYREQTQKEVNMYERKAS